jgi:hypothetical protein
MKNSLFISAIIMFGYVASVAQAPDWSWAKNGVGRGTEYGTSIATDGNGNSYITGYFRSDSIMFGAFKLYNTSMITHYDLYIVKYDSMGTVLWANAAGGFGDEQAMSVALDSTGNVYVTGMFSSDSITFGNISLMNGGPPFYDMFLVKYDANGNALWARSAGDVGFEIGNSVTTANGNVCVAGNFDSPSITIGTTVLNNSGFGSDLFVAEFDSAGSLMWAKSAGGNDNDIPACVAADDSGYIYMTGGFYSSSITFGAFTLNNANAGNNNDLFIVKYDLSGNVLWAEKAGGAADDAGFGLASDHAGNVYLTGSYISPSITFGTTTLNNLTPGSNMFLIKFNSAGNVLWARQSLGGSADAFSVAADSDGSAFVTGDFGLSAITFGSIMLNTVSSGIDMYIVKYDSAGTEQWVKGAGGNYAVFGRSLDIDNSGNIYITGDFNCTAVSFDSTLLTNTISGDYDIFIAKLDSSFVTGINSAFPSDNEINIHPNPFYTSAVIAFTLSKKVKVSVKIYDMNGRLVTTIADKIFNEGRNESMWNADKTDSGIYFLEVRAEGLLKRQKIIVAK